jgi:hypothetical protein
MLSSLAAMLAMLGMPPELTERPSYLFQIQAGPDQKTNLNGRHYDAQPGDLVLFDDHNTLTAKVYRWSGTGSPLHAAIVFRKQDGTPAILEAGTNAVMRVFIFDLDPRLRGFDGTILVRRLRKPLLPEQSLQLRDFAVAQEGKSYAIGRAILHASPLRPRNASFSQYFGRTVLDRDRWICSELAVAAATAAGVLDAETFPANMMLPRDLCYDERYDLSPYYFTPALWYPREQLEHVGAGVRVGGVNER